MATWKDLWARTTTTAQTAKEAGSGVAGKLFGVGKTAGGATVVGAGGIFGIFNWMVKGVVGAFLKVVNKGFSVIKNYPRIAAFFVAIAAAVGAVFAVSGLASWRDRSKTEKSQRLEADDLKASIEMNKAARVETSAAMGQGGMFPLRDDWGARMKGGLPGQQSVK